MSRSYKKHPAYNLKPGRRKNFRKDYNRYIRHKKTEYMNGSHYTQTNASWHAYQYHEVFEGYLWTQNETMQHFNWQYEKDIHEAEFRISRWHGLYTAHDKYMETHSYEEQRNRHWKAFYRK